MACPLFLIIKGFTMLQKLNIVFKAILQNPLNEDNWTKFDLICILLNRYGYVFNHSDKEICKDMLYLTNVFDLKMQLEFINSNQKKALDLQLYQLRHELIKYKQILKVWKTNYFPQLKIYQADYFIIKSSNTISYYLTNVPLLNIKIESIINRRCKLS